MTTILSIQSQVAGATVGNSIAAFAMQRLGARVLCAPTTQFGRRPDRGLPGGGPVPAEVLASILEALAADAALDAVDAVVTGYMASPEQAKVARTAIERVRQSNPRAFVVVDPVIGDTGRGLYVRPETAAAVVDVLVPIADVITPNAFELAFLTQTEPSGDLDALFAAANAYGRPVVATSAPVADANTTAALYVARTGAWLVTTPRLPHPAHGAGDLFTALFTARRALGQSLVVALEAALGSVHDVIVRSLIERSDHLCVVEAQDKLEHPDSWPTARQFRPG